MTSEAKKASDDDLLKKITEHFDTSTEEFKRTFNKKAGLVTREVNMVHTPPKKTTTKTTRRHSRDPPPASATATAVARAGPQNRRPRSNKNNNPLVHSADARNFRSRLRYVSGPDDVPVDEAVMAAPVLLEALLDSPIVNLSKGIHHAWDSETL